MPFISHYVKILGKISLFLLLSFSIHYAHTAKKTKSKNQQNPISSFKMDFNVEKYTLDNGLTVLLHIDHQAPLINYQTWFRVGSKDDPPQQTGMAHLFEHLMFRGTNKREGTEFIKEIQAKGIDFNAYTSADETVYYFNLPKKELEFIAELEAERMYDLNLKPENVKLEQDIVKEERLMRYKNQPQSVWPDLVQLAFQKNNYRWPTIGYPKDIDRISSKECQQFYRTFYAPNNAIIVISGPIHIGKTKRIIKTHYGSIPASTLPQTSYPIEPSQKKMRTQTLYRKVQSPSLTLAYHTPSAGSQDIYALDLLGFILGGSQSSRLHQLLVEKQAQSISVHASNATFNHAGLFIIRSSLHPNKKINSVYNDMMKEIKKLTKNPPQINEINRAKTHLMKAYINSLKTASGKASILGSYETTFGDYSYLFKELEKYQSVTAQDIMKVAQKFLKPYQQTRIKLLSKK